MESEAPYGGRRRSWCTGDSGRTEFKNWASAHSKPDGGANGGYGKPELEEAPVHEAPDQSEQLKQAAEFGLMLLQQNQALEAQMKELREELDNSQELNRELKEEVMQAHSKQSQLGVPTIKESPMRSVTIKDDRQQRAQLHAVEEMEERIAQVDSELAMMTRKHTEAITASKNLQRKADLHEGKLKDMEAELQKAKQQEIILTETISSLQTQLERSRRQADDNVSQRKAASQGNGKKERAALLVGTVEEMLLLITECGEDYEPKHVEQALEMVQDLRKLLSDDD